MSADPVYSDMELSAVQEIANIGTGTSAGALGQLICRSVEIDVPRVEFVDLAEATERIGPLESEVFGVLTPVTGGIRASLLLAFPAESAGTLCGLLGTEAHTEMGWSCLQEIGNILTGSYTTAISQLTGISIEPEPPMVANDMLGAIVGSVLVASGSTSKVLFMRTGMHIEGELCEFGFLFVPEEGAITVLLAALGLA